jgi:hypothetical protein
VRDPRRRLRQHRRPFGIDGRDVARPRTTIQRSTPDGPLGEVSQRLAAAGFHPKTNAVSGTAVGSLLVGGVTIYAYRTTIDATADLRRIEQVYAPYPGRGLAKLVGTHLYTIAKPRSLTAADRARFAKVVIAGEAIGP